MPEGARLDEGPVGGMLMRHDEGGEHSAALQVDDFGLGTRQRAHLRI